jgi:hypothetical protein
MLVAITATALSAACTHDFGAFTVSEDAAASDGSSGSSDSGADAWMPIDAPNVSCTVGQVAFGGHCYFATSAQASWDAANTACQAAGAHLVTLGSMAEQNAASKVSPGVDRWIGLHIQGGGTSTNPSSFSWVTGEPSTYANWGSGEPNGAGSCVRMRGDGSWADQSCNNSLAAVCEID